MSRRTRATAGPAKPKAKRGQHDTPVKAVREPADWNLEREIALSVLIAQAGQKGDLGLASAGYLANVG